MYVPTLCPFCTAIVIVPAHGVLEMGASHVYRCPSCQAIVCEAAEPNPLASHPEAPTPGPPLTADDLIDFHLELSDERHPTEPPTTTRWP